MAKSKTVELFPGLPAPKKQKPSVVAKKPKVEAKSIGRPAPLVALHERYRLVYEPGEEADPIVKAELDALRELYKQRTSREIADEADTRAALESAGFLKPTVSRKRAADLKRGSSEAFASAMDALDYELEQLNKPFYEAEAFQKPFSYAAERLGGERAGRAVESAINAADRALGRAIGPAATAGAAVLFPPSLLATTEFGRETAAPFIGEAVGGLEPVVEPARESPVSRLAARGARAAAPTVGQALGVVGQSIANLPALPTLMLLSGMPVSAYPKYKQPTLETVEDQFEDMASNPEKYVPISVATTDRTLLPDANPGIQAAVAQTIAGALTPQVQSALDQNQYGPFSLREDSFFKGRAAENGFDVSRWDSLTPGEKIQQAYTKNSYLAQTLRSVVRTVGETGSTVAGVRAIAGALKSAPADDAAELKMILEGIIAPYAYAKSVAERDGLSAGVLVAFRDQPVDFVIALNAAVRAGGRVGGAVARTGVLGERAKAGAAVGRMITAARRTRGVTTVREVPIEVPEPSFMGFADAGPALARRAEAVEAGRVSPEGVPYEIVREEAAPPILVGYTSPNLTSVAGLRLKSWVASSSRKYADWLERRAANRYTRRQANVADGVAVEIEQALTDALGRAPTALERERAAFELTWAREQLNAEIVDGELVLKQGAAVTPGTIAAYFRGRAEQIKNSQKFKKDEKNRELNAQIDKFTAQAIEWEKIDLVRLDPKVIKELRRVARPLGKRNDELIAAALGVPLNEAKRGNYLRLLIIDPEFEKTARALKAERNVGKVSPARLIRVQKDIRKLARQVSIADVRGFGKKSRPKSRIRFSQLVDDLIVNLREGEDLARRFGDVELADEYARLRESLVLARAGAPERAAALAKELEDIQAGRARVVPEAAEAVFEESRVLRREAREAERVAGEAADVAARRLEEAGVRRTDARVVALARQRVEDARRAYETDQASTMLSPEQKQASRSALVEAEDRLARLEAAEGARVEAVRLQREATGLAQKQGASLREAQRIVLNEQPVLDTDQVRAALDASERIAGVRVRQKRDFGYYTLERARGEVLDEFIARVEANDQNALLHLVQRGPIEDIDAPRIVESRRTLNFGPAGRIQPGRLKPSKADMFALGGESTNRMWKNLMFDTAELVAAEGWRNKMRQMIELTGVKVTLNTEAQRKANARAQKRINAGEDPDRVMEEEVQRQLEADSVEFSLGDFKVINMLNPREKAPNEKVFLGMVRENIDPESVAGQMWRELTDRTINPNAPGDYILIPRAVYDGVQKSLRDEAFRFRAPTTGVGRVFSGFGLDRATRAWRTLTLNVLPKTAFANFIGSTILAVQAGAGPRAFYYAWRALRGSTDANGRVMPIPQELLQRYYASLTIEVGRDARLAGYPYGVQWAAAWAAKWMNTMRKFNGMSEDFGRLAVWYSKAYPEAMRAAARETDDSSTMMLRAKSLNDRALDMLEDMAEDAPEWRAKNAAFIQQSYDFLGDLHKGGKWASRARIAIPFWQWYVHMLKLTFFTMPVKYPGRALMLQQLGQIGDEYQRTHGVMIPWGEDLVPLFTESQDIGGMPQWVTTTVGTSNWYPQGTPAGLGGREGYPNINSFVRGSINPAFTNSALVLISLTNISIGGGSAVEYSDYSGLKAAKNEYGNEITSFDGDFFNYTANRLGQIVPLSPTIMSMAGRAPTSTLWNIADRDARGPQIERKRQDVLSVIEDPWSTNSLSFLAKAIFGLTFTEVPGIGPVERRRLQLIADAEAKKMRIEQQNLARNTLDALGFASPNQGGAEPAPTPFGTE